LRSILRGGLSQLNGETLNKDAGFAKSSRKPLCYAFDEAVMDYKTLRFSIEGRLARITLSRPEVSNRVDARMLRELIDVCEAIGADDAVCITLLSAEGSDFCAGWEDSTRDELRQALQPNLDPFGCLAALPSPVIAALQGSVVSAGMELALACDVRVAAEDARFGLPEVSEGTLPLAGGSQRLPRIAGPAVGTSMLLLGDELDAPAAHHAGIVSRVFPAKTLASEAVALANRIAAHGPLALRYAKEAVHQGAEMTLDQALRYELDLSVILQTTSDRAEGVCAFSEKRPPKFEGR
jgi:enoyl-CoA hydratase/carnithine racemase